MARKPHVDDSTFRAALKSGLTAQEIAHQFGYRVSSVYARAQRLRHGHPCKECPSLAEPGRSRCADCQERHKERTRALRAERRKAGLCPECGRPGEFGGYCADHLPVHLSGHALAAAIRDVWSADRSAEPFIRHLLHRLGQEIPQRSE